MISIEKPRGAVFRCPVCHAEITVLAYRMGDFHPRCCNTDMARLPRSVQFYVCPVCGAQIGVLRKGAGAHSWRCCNTDMRQEAA